MSEVADRPSRFFEANAAADDRLQELKRLKRDNEMLRRELDALLSSPVAELHTQIQELTAENADLIGRCASYSEECRSLRDERDDALRRARRAGASL